MARGAQQHGGQWRFSNDGHHGGFPTTREAVELSNEDYEEVKEEEGDKEKLLREEQQRAEEDPHLSPNPNQQRAEEDLDMLDLNFSILPWLLLLFVARSLVRHNNPRLQTPPGWLMNLTTCAYARVWVSPTGCTDARPD